MNETKPIAHVRKDSNGNWAQPQSLDEHLSGTAELAESFAKAFNQGRPFDAERSIGRGSLREGNRPYPLILHRGPSRRLARLDRRAKRPRLSPPERKSRRNPCRISEHSRRVLPKLAAVEIRFSRSRYVPLDTDALLLPRRCGLPGYRINWINVR